MSLVLFTGFLNRDHVGTCVFLRNPPKMAAFKTTPTGTVPSETTPGDRVRRLCGPEVRMPI